MFSAYILVFVAVILSGCFWAEPQKIGLNDGKLKPCPDSPNCVSSRDDGDHRIEPLKINTTQSRNQDRIVAFFKNEYDASIIQRSDTYLRMTVSTTLGFVDDLEFRYRPENDVVHVRSASRLGHSDLGVNRQRIENLREHLKNDANKTVD
jgi:uncharacterized protein (DUF1499 family)